MNNIILFFMCKNFIFSLLQIKICKKNKILQKNKEE